MAAVHDLIVIGAGATGLAAARAARAAGKSVLLLDRNAPGGDCTFTGCVPSKALLESARRVHAARSGGDYGFTAPVEVDMPAVMARVRRVIGEISGDESATVLQGEGITVRRTGAVFTGPRELRTDDGDVLTAERIVIATGASATVPPIDGLSGVDHLTNDSVFDLDELPGHLLVLGGGPIACELAQAFRRLGSDVTILEKAPRLIGKDDPEAAVVLRSVLTREGVTVHTGADVVGVSAGPTVILGDGRTVSGTHLLVAVGRTPMTRELGLEAAGVRVEANGRIAVDDHLATSVSGVYAAGDCASPYQFTHAGDEQGRIAAQNCFGRGAKSFDPRVLPWVTFTEPEIGHVGMTEEQAFAAHGEHARVVVVPFADQDRARCAGETDGFVKIVAAPRGLAARASKYLLSIVGMTVVCPVGGELIHEAVPLIKAHGLAGRMASPMHAYPTWSITTRIAVAQLFGSGGVHGPGVRPAQADGGASAWDPS